MKILITGCAGFIGHSVSKFFISMDNLVIGIDNLNNYYSTSLKKDRLKDIEKKNPKKVILNFISVT